MRYGKIMAYLFTALFLIVAVLGGYLEPEAKPDPPLSVTVPSNGNSEEIRCWERGENEYYFFLPSYASLSQARLQIQGNAAIRMDDQVLSNGMACDLFRLKEAYLLSATTDGKEHAFSVTFLQSENVPAMYIDVQSGSMDYIHAQKGNEESGTIRLYTKDGDLDHLGNVESINGRGNVTWTLADKKAYSFTLSEESDLLDMGLAQKWILLSDIFDPSHLRNKIVYDFARAAGLAFSPDSQWVDLYLNSEYAGLYLLSERNEVHPQRVDIPQENSFLVSVEMEQRLVSQKYPYVSTAAGTALRIHHSTIISEELEEIWQSAENAILSADGIDPQSGKHFTQLIDLDSWARKYLIEEIFGNMDAAISQFFYYDGNSGAGKIYAGPIWDYDSSMCAYVPTVFFADKPYAWQDTEASWYHALCQKDAFQERVTELYETTFRPLLAELLDTGMDAYSAQISQAAALDQLRWSTDSAAATTASMHSYMTERMAFLDSVWLEGVEYCTVLADQGADDGTVCYAVKPGECLISLPAYEESPDILGWYYVSSDEPFDITQPIYEDTKIYLKSAYNGEEEISPVQYAPIAALALLLVGLALADILRTKRSGRQKHERAKISP